MDDKKKSKKTRYDLSEVVANIDKVKLQKAAKEKKPSTSIKPLTFDLHPDDSPLKAAIIERINANNLTYSDIYNYCTDLKGGDISEGQKLGYNIISGLKNRHSMIDTTFSMLCDFLKLDILLVERKEDDEDEEDQ
jgi:hypothetical protein